MSKICEELKKLINEPQKKASIEKQLKSGTSNKLCLCLTECDCQPCRNAKKIYPQEFLENNRQFLPVGEKGLPFLLENARKKWPKSTSLHEKLSKEQSDRDEYRETEKTRQNGNLPNPGVLIVHKDTNTCSLCGFIEVEEKDNELMLEPD